MARRVVVLVLLLAMAGAVAWVAKFALSDGPSTRGESDHRPAARDEPAPRDPVAKDDPGTLPQQNRAERAQLIGYVRERGGRLGFASADAFLDDSGGVRWYLAGDELPDGPVTALAAPGKGADAWLAGLTDLPPVPILVARWTDATDAGVAQVAGLDQVAALTIAGATGVTDEGARHLRGLAGLRLLDLGATKVTDAGLVFLRDLKDLEVLRLSATATGDAGLAHLRGLTKLVALAPGTKTTIAGIAELRGAPLQRLDLAGLRAIRTLAPLAAFPGLEVLDLKTTGVGDAAMPTLGGLTKLRVLGLADTAVTDTGVATLAKLTALRRLDLSGLPLTNAGVRHVGACVRLRELDLAFTRVGNDGLARLKSLGVLEVLDLTGTATGDEGLAHLAGLPHLRELRLPAAVTAAALPHLRKMPALRRLVVPKSMSDETLAELQAGLPNCTLARA